VGVLEEEKILSLVCGILSRTRGYRLVWVGTAEADGTIRVECSAGTPRSFSRGRAPLGRHGRRAAPPGNVVRTGGTIIARRSATGSPPSGGRLPASRARSLRRGPDRAARFPAQGSRRARRHGRRLRRRRDGGARRDGPPRGERDPGGKTPRNLRQRESVLRRTAAEPAGRCHPRARGEGGPCQSGAAEMLGYASRGFCSTPTRFRSWRNGCGGRPARRIAGARQRRARSEWDATLLRMDGSTFPGEIRLTWAPREDKNDTFVPKRRGPLGMVVLRDVNERARVLRELRKERDFSNRMLDISGRSSCR